MRSTLPLASLTASMSEIPDSSAEVLGHALRASEGFQLIARSIPDAILAVDAEQTVRYASAEAETYFGRSSGSIVGTAFLDLFESGDRPVFPPVLADGTPGAWDVRPAADPDTWLNVSVLVPDAPDSTSGLGKALDHVTLVLVRDVPQARGQVRDRADLYRRALDAANHIVIISDVQADDSPVVFANQHFFDVTGYSRDEVIGQNCRFLQTRGDGTRDDDQDGVREVRRALAAGEGTHVILRNYRKDGELFYNELFLTPVRDETDRVVRYVGVQNDVTERVLAQQEVASHQGLLRAFYDSAPVIMGVVQRDRAGVVHRMANPRAAELFGVSPDAIPGARPRELGFTDAESRRWDETVRRCAEFGETCSFETVHPWDSDHDDDGSRSLRITVSRVRAEGGLHQADLFSYIGEDVTEARRSAARIRTLAATVESASDAILITDARIDPPGPTIVYANPAHGQLTGYRPDEVLGQSPRMFQGPETERAVLDRVRRRIEAGEPVSAETVNYRKDGSPFTVHWEISPVRDDAGEIVNWVGMQRDVTDRRRLEFEVLEAAGREQEWMAREIHDGLGQVLTGSGMQLHVLARALKEKGEASLAADAVRIQGYVSDALDQARTISRGLIPVTVDPGELAPALDHLCEAAGQSLDVEIAFEASGPFAVASSERAGHLYRIAQEALANAARHGEAHRVTVTLTEDGSEGTMIIRDDGIGITDDALEAGGGLGMRTMAYRARRVSGTLDVQQHPDGGTQVRVRFPLVLAEDGVPKASG